MKGRGPESAVRPSKPRKSNFLGGISWDLLGYPGGARIVLTEQKKFVFNFFAPIKIKKKSNPENGHFVLVVQGLFSVDVSDIFFFFLCSGEGKGESGAPGKEGGFCFGKSQEGGGGSPRLVGAGVRGAGDSVCGEFGGGRAKYLSSGPKCSPEFFGGYFFGRGEKTPTPKISALLRKRPVLLRANFVLTKDRKRPYYRHFCGKMHREGSCSKAARDP